jgi:protein SCO1/2
MTQRIALILIAGLIAVLVLTLGIANTRDTPALAGSPWSSNYFPNLPVVTHDGKKLRFYDDLIKGKIVVINFIYTSCTDICSLSTARLAQVRELLGDRVGRDIFFYSITLDPVLDGPEVLKKYAANFYDGPGWLFLTGEPEDIDAIRQKLGERSRSLKEHRNDVMLGNDATGEWGRDSIFTDIARLAQTIRDMDPEERETAHAPANTHLGDKVMNLGGPGQALFMKACSSCHTVGNGALVGPDLAGVTARRDQDWLIRFITSPGKMISGGDPLALALVAEHNGLRMPNLGLTDNDARDVLAYLITRSRRIDEERSARDTASTASQETKPPATSTP